MGSSVNRRILRVSVIVIIFLFFMSINIIVDSNVKNTAVDINQFSSYSDLEEESIDASYLQTLYRGYEVPFTDGFPTEEYPESEIPDEEIMIAEINDGIQEVTVDISRSRFSPSIIVLQKGVRAKIKFNAEFLNECNEVIAFPDQGFVLGLYKGQLETEMFDVEGDFIFECWMGMINGYAKVVDDINSVDIETIKNEVIYYEPSEGESCH